MNFKSLLKSDLLFYSIVIIISIVMYLVLKYFKIQEGNTSNTGLTVDMNEGADKGKITANLDELNEFQNSLASVSGSSGDSTSTNVVVNDF
jgi:preprotein translocase subunit SecF